MENIYDRDTINDYKRMIKGLINYDAIEESDRENPSKLEKYWQIGRAHV